MNVNIKQLNDLFLLMAKHNIRELQAGDVRAVMGTAAPVVIASTSTTTNADAPTKPKKKRSKDPTDELLDLISNREDDQDD